MAKTQKDRGFLMAIVNLQSIARDTHMRMGERKGLEAEFRSLRCALEIDKCSTFCKSDEEILDAAKASLASIKSCFEEAATTESEWRKISGALAEIKKSLI